MPNGTYANGVMDAFVYLVPVTVIALIISKRLRQISVIAVSALPIMACVKLYAENERNELTVFMLYISIAGIVISVLTFRDMLRGK